MAGCCWLTWTSRDRMYFLKGTTRLTLPAPDVSGKDSAKGGRSESTSARVLPPTRQKGKKAKSQKGENGVRQWRRMQICDSVWRLDGYELGKSSPHVLAEVALNHRSLRDWSLKKTIQHDTTIWWRGGKGGSHVLWHIETGKGV